MQQSLLRNLRCRQSLLRNFLDTNSYTPVVELRFSVDQRNA